MSEEHPQNVPGPEDQPEQPKFDPSAAHQQKPRLRPVRGFPARHGDNTLLGLADAQQISQKAVFTVPAAQAILPLMNGENDLDTIVQQVGRGLTRPMLEQLVAQLDDAGLLEGPTFEAMLTTMREEYDSSEHLPPAGTAMFADLLVMQEVGQDADDQQKAEMGPSLVKRQFDAWIDQALKNAERPSFDALPKAIVAPHIDYARGWLNYAHIYGRMRVVDRPDRIVILGTNHFGRCTGVCGCDKGFETPLGVSPLDTEMYEALRRNIGEPHATTLFEHRYDHEREHSIELQTMWIQHVMGQDDEGAFPKVFAALVHDPAVNNGRSYDEKGLDLEPFVNAMKQTLSELPGNTLVVCSADLSHVGQQFGDKTTLAGDEGDGKEFRDKVISHDREMLDLFNSNKPAELVASMAWQQNPTRWCSVGAMVATLQIVEPQDIQFINYAAAMDQQGTAMISSAAYAMY